MSALRLYQPDQVPNDRPPLYNPSQLDDAGLSANAFRVFGRICRRWTRARGCYESKPAMAEGCRMNRKTLYAALAELEDRRFIERTGRGPGARIDWRPPSEWLAEPAGVRPNPGPERSSQSEPLSPGVSPGSGAEVSPNPGAEGSSQSRGLKGYPPKGIHEGTKEETTAIGVGDGSAGPEPEPGAVVFFEEDNPDPPTPTREADPHRDAKNAAFVALRERGVDAENATALAAEHWAIVPEVVERYDAGWESGDIAGPGWLIPTLRDYRRPRPTPAKQAATHTGRTPEQDRGSKAAAEATREIAAGEVPGTPGGASDWRAVMEAEREAERARIEAAGGVPGRRSRAGTRSARDLPTEPPDPAVLPATVLPATAQAATAQAATAQAATGTDR